MALTEPRPRVEQPTIPPESQGVSQAGNGHRPQTGKRHRPQTEQEILRVLWANPDHLVRGDILKRLPQEHRPSPGRVGQILSVLHLEGLLDRVLGKSQGSSSASYYTLSDQGRLVCQELGFAQKLSFAVAPEVLTAMLSPMRLTAAVKRSGQIVALWGTSGGLGRTTLAAHLAAGLSREVGDNKPVLVADLDFGAPQLDAFFAPKGPLRCSGLAGLFMAYLRQAPRKREVFLLRALSDVRYVVKPAEFPNLIFLPSGLGTNHPALSPHERDEALTLLRQEAKKSAHPPVDAGQAAKPGFFAALREAMAARFERVLIDTQHGHSLGAWIATQGLADELVLCLNETSTSASTIDGIRTMLAKFLEHSQCPDRTGAVKFLFRLAAPTTLHDLDGWIDQHLLRQPEGSTSESTYGTEQLVYSARLAENQYDWQYIPFYQHLITKLRSGTSERTCDAVCPAELQALKIVLGSENDRISSEDHRNRRSMAAGLLETTPIEELVYWIRWAKGRELLPKHTDTSGARLLRSVLQGHAIALYKEILGPQANWSTEEEAEPGKTVLPA